jgi:Uma2 family endonuclease
MATATKTKLLTADDLLRLYSKGVRGELIRGVLCETMAAGQDHGKYLMNLGGDLRSFVKPRRLGSLMASDSGVWLERDPDTVREPDIAFISAEKVPLGVSVPGYSEVVPDLVVEFASPSDSRREVNDKARMWHSHGVRLVWAAYPDSRSVDVHGEDGSIVTLTENDTLDGGDVLAGFTCPVSEIFDL